MSETIERRVARRVKRIGQLLRQGRHHEADVRLAEILDLIRRHLRRDQEQLARCLSTLWALCRPRSEERVALKRRRLQRRPPPPPHAQELRFVRSLNHLGLLYRHVGRNREAQEAFRQALTIARQTSLVEPPDLAVLMGNLAGSCQAIGDVRQAEVLHCEVLELLHGAGDPADSDILPTLSDLAELCCENGDPVAARILSLDVLERCRDRRQPGHPKLVEALARLADSHQELGDLVAAEPLRIEMAEILRVSYGADHPAFAYGLHQLAELYRAAEDYEEAVLLYRRALRILRGALSDDPTEVAVVLTSWATLECSRGGDRQAAALYRQALEIRRAALGETHPDTAAVLSSLAALYHRRGRLKAAAALYEQASSVLRRAPPEHHARLVRTLRNLALLHRQTADRRAAESRSLEILELGRRRLGEHHPDLAPDLHHLAALYLEMGRFAEAEACALEAVEICRCGLGERHPDTALALHHAACLRREMGDPAAAETQEKEALEIYRTALGQDHPEVAMCLENLAIMAAAASRYQQAHGLMSESCSIDDGVLERIFGVGSAAEWECHRELLRKKRDRFLSLVIRHLGEEPAAIRESLDLVLRRDVLRPETLPRIHDPPLPRDPNLRDTVRRHRALRVQIARRFLAGPGRVSPAAHQWLLKHWQERQRRLEDELKPKAMRRRAGTSCDELARTLPARSSLLAFVRFQPFDFRAVPRRGDSGWEPARYLAFLFSPQEAPQVKVTDLGDASVIETSVAAFEASRIAPEQPRRRSSEQSRATARGQAAEQLSKALFEPVRPWLRKTERLVLVADGALARLPFASLPYGKRHLGDRFRIRFAPFPDQIGPDRVP